MLEVQLLLGNPMGTVPGTYRLLIAGWKAPCDAQVMTRLHVGLIVKVSGIIPGGPQKPDKEDYAVNEQFGCQPMSVDFPIKHANAYKGIFPLSAH